MQKYVISDPPYRLTLQKNEIFQMSDITLNHGLIKCVLFACVMCDSAGVSTAVRWLIRELRRAGEDACDNNKPADRTEISWASPFPIHSSKNRDELMTPFNESAVCSDTEQAYLFTTGKICTKCSVCFNQNVRDIQGA